MFEYLHGYTSKRKNDTTKANSHNLADMNHKWRFVTMLFKHVLHEIPNSASLRPINQLIIMLYKDEGKRPDRLHLKNLPSPCLVLI